MAVHKNSRLANGVGLDTPESVVEIIDALVLAGYNLGDKVPQTTQELMNTLTAFITNEIHSSQLKEAQVAISEVAFMHYYS